MIDMDEKIESAVIMFGVVIAGLVVYGIISKYIPSGL
jgi:hypothetical protein